MLYDQWRDVAFRQPNEFALHEVASGRRWTFSELFAAGEKWDSAAAPVRFPQGHAAEFVFSVLAAWRDRTVACPLEPESGVPNIPPPPPECVHLKKTSATVGAERLIAFRASQLAADADHIMRGMGLRPDWPNLGVISLAHSYGFSNLILPLLLHGIPLILVPAPLPDLVRRSAEATGGVTLPGVPAMWRAWHEAGGIPPQVKLAISAGAPLALELEQAVFDASGIKIHNFYGASECGGIAYDESDRPRTAAAYAGRLMPGVEVSANEDGCLIVRGPAVGETYWPEKSDTLGHGHFQTADQADLADGKVFLRGRATDIINVAGRKVAPEIIEQAISAHPRVRECLVFGVPSDDDRSETIVAMVCGSVDEKELKQFLLPRLPAWQLPRRWQWVDSLPVNARGKISRATLRRQFKL